MKTFNFEKKLSLNKKTISHLDEVAMVAAKGGVYRTAYSYCLYTCTGRPCDGSVNTRCDTDPFTTEI